MKAYIFLKRRDENKLLAVVDNLEVVPRGLYIIEGVTYQYSGQPKFNIKKFEAQPGARYVGGDDESHQLESVELVVEQFDDSDLL